MSTDPAFYRNKSVLILGKQQSAFETANHIYGQTAHVMMVSRGRPRLAHVGRELLRRARAVGA